MMSEVSQERKSSSSMYKKRGREAWEMAELVRCLLCKYEDQGSGPQYPHTKLSMMVCAFDSSTGEAGNQEDLESRWPANVAELVSSRFSETPFLRV